MPRHDLWLRSRLKEMEEVASLAQLNKLEKIQLYTKTEMVRKYYALMDSGKHKIKGRVGKFKTRAAKYKYHSLTYIPRQAQGVK